MLALCSIPARRRLPPALAGVLALTLVSTASGCSFLFVEGPPARRAPGEPLACTDSVGSPVVDTLFGAGFAAVAVHESTRKVDPYFAGERRNSVIAASVGAAVLAASAYFGWTRTRACRRAIAELRSAAPASP